MTQDHDRHDHGRYDTGQSETLGLKILICICVIVMAMSLGYALGTEHATNRFKQLLKEELQSTYGCETDTDCDEADERSHKRLWKLAGEQNRRPE